MDGGTSVLCVLLCLAGCMQVRLMCQFGNTVTVEVLPVYIPSQAEKDDPALYAANIRKLIVSDLGLYEGLRQQHGLPQRLLLHHRHLFKAYTVAAR